MSWSGSASGEFHDVVKRIKELTITGDQKAIDLGHVQQAKDAALTVIDRAPATSAFSVSLGGHTTDRETYSLQVGISVRPSQS